MASFQAPSQQPVQQQQQQQRPPTSPEFGDFLSTGPTTIPAQPPLMQAPPTQLLQPQPSADSLLLGDAEPPKLQKVCWDTWSTCIHLHLEIIPWVTYN